MPFDPQLDAVAERFVQFVHRETALPVIVCDEKGTIVRATVRARIGAHHPGALRIVRGELPEYLVTEEMEAADPRMKRGCNAPIRVGGQVLGTFGVAGPLEVSRPVAHVAAGVLAGWMRELAQRRALHAAAEGLVATVAPLAERVEEVARESAATEAEMAAAAGRAGERAGRTDEVLRAVQGIAAQSRTLAINGGVEASRAGDMGRAFAVVAREMLVLAEDARDSAEQIQASLAAARAGLAAHAEALAGLTRAGGEELEAMRGATRAAAVLRQEVGSLAASYEAEEETAPAGEAAELGDAFWAMAERLMRLISEQSGQPSIVCDQRGTIVKAIDRARVGQPHAGAQRILRGEVDEAAVTPEEAARNPAVREGCSVPIVVGGRRVGTYGVTGPVALTRPLSRVAARVLATRVREHRSRSALELALGRFSAELEALSERTRTVAGEAARRSSALLGAADGLREKLAVTEGVARAVQQISQQTRIIAVNGAVEAAGNAERSRTFGNVARDMVKLAEDTHRAGKEISAALAEISEAVRAHSAAGERLVQAARVRGAAAAEGLGAVARIRDGLAEVLRSFDEGGAGARR